MTNKFHDDYVKEMKQKSRQELEAFAVTMQEAYDELMAAAEDTIDDFQEYGSPGLSKLKRVAMYGD